MTVSNPRHPNTMQGKKDHSVDCPRDPAVPRKSVVVIKEEKEKDRNRCPNNRPMGFSMFRPSF